VSTQHHPQCLILWTCSARKGDNHAPQAQEESRGWPPVRTGGKKWSPALGQAAIQLCFWRPQVGWGTQRRLSGWSLSVDSCVGSAVPCGEKTPVVKYAEACSGHLFPGSSLQSWNCPLRPWTPSGILKGHHQQCGQEIRGPSMASQQWRETKRRKGRKRFYIPERHPERIRGSTAGPGSPPLFTALRQEWRLIWAGSQWTSTLVLLVSPKARILQ
jgi:hypothetical protein